MTWFLHGDEPRAHERGAAMRDLTASLVRATELRDGWSAYGVTSLASQWIADGLASTFDWDRLAGERWASVFEAERLVALISADLPLVLAAADRCGDPRFSRGDRLPVMIAVESFDGEELCADAGMLRDVFGVAAESVRAERFSATELWRATV
jgi:hypothetical protein